ncbi:MAG: 16S rRNA (cytosine(967)-C(5))-methyltransferase RsmB [Sutterellaceae bacterium]|nr:16S rRNA (cytosine(967)-C(5))-methyltransferase RsmB [Burkholderiaceae bacterium]MCX7900852.1 16S rRNA (cytosine(967)-C(5))-methyltransferase RsmB [Burkholderiaceae bacterium]MDW8429281.1 16S rRNA (cytosine(967)-C(5))-methyltransferase RsmB [Sutterellaceae bacterium]
MSDAPIAAGPPLAAALALAAAAWREFRQGRALDRALEWAAAQVMTPHPRALAAAQDVAYSAARHLALLEALIARLAPRPPAPPVAALLALALSQLISRRHPPYAVVDQAVHAAQAVPSTRKAAPFINACLRRYLREAPALHAAVESEETVRHNAPRWWIDRLRSAYPQAWTSILQTQREAPPLVLRVNARRTTTDEYLRRLRLAGIAATRVGAQAVWLHEPRPVADIPGFAAGEVSVQDAGAQLAAPWLQAGAGMRVLDACAAPGGKTAHLAELTEATIDAVERDAARSARISENLARLGLASDRVRVIVGDAAQPAQWHRGPLYDRILLDAPCTASGIVRRHPDIPWLRRPADVAQLATQQARLLDALWPLLAPAGRLLYVVCSLFPEEGVEQAAAFERRWTDARRVPLPGLQAGEGQLLPVPLTAATAWTVDCARPTLHDGFFFALFEKR